MPELNAWIEATFRLDLLRLARIHSLGDGVLIPHRDFVEFLDEKPAWTRIHIPIMTNDQCLHAEEDTVFRMRLGEVWHFDASRLHSATNFSAQRRLNLCLDFELGDLPLSAIFQYAAADAPIRAGHPVPVAGSKRLQLSPGGGPIIAHPLLCRRIAGAGLRMAQQDRARQRRRGPPRQINRFQPVSSRRARDAGTVCTLMGGGFGRLHP